MKIAGKNYKTIWFNEKNNLVQIIDQTKLPHSFEIITLSNIDDAVKAIKDMKVRGAPLIGGAAAYGIYLAMKENPSDEYLKKSSDKLIDSRPTAVNLKSAIDIMNRELQNINIKDRHEENLAYYITCQYNLEVGRRASILRGLTILRHLRELAQDSGRIL